MKRTEHQNQTFLLPKFHDKFHDKWPIYVKFGYFLSPISYIIASKSVKTPPSQWHHLGNHFELRGAHFQTRNTHFLMRKLIMLLVVKFLKFYQISITKAFLRLHQYLYFSGILSARRVTDRQISYQNFLNFGNKY